MGFQCGIVGLPNVGKSTLFNALTATASAQAANYPFCTIEPNVGRISVPDSRLYQLAEMAGSQKIIPNFLEVVDIAGLVRGASLGEGLGNQFLGHIREVDAIIHVLRCFDSTDITHVEGTVDPIRDIDIIETELMLADLKSLERRAANAAKKAKGGSDPTLKIQDKLIENALVALREGHPASSIFVAEEEKALFRQLQLLTSKPALYVCNVGEKEAISGNVYSERVQAYAKSRKAPVVLVSAAIEAEIASFLNLEEKKEFLNELGLAESGFDQISREGYNLLNLLTFFTVGPKEAHA